MDCWNPAAGRLTAQYGATFGLGADDGTALSLETRLPRHFEEQK
jgi:hypothetical protein